MVSQNIQPFSPTKSNPVCSYYMNQINHINYLIIHKGIFFPSLEITFVDVCKKSNVYKICDQSQAVKVKK